MPRLMNILRSTASGAVDPARGAESKWVIRLATLTNTSHPVGRDRPQINLEFL